MIIQMIQREYEARKTVGLFYAEVFRFPPPIPTWLLESK
jgi:hypothetical protein